MMVVMNLVEMVVVKVVVVKVPGVVIVVGLVFDRGTAVAMVSVLIEGPFCDWHREHEKTSY